MSFGRNGLAHEPRRERWISYVWCTCALSRRACWVTPLHPSGVASLPLQLGLGSPSLGCGGPRDLKAGPVGKSYVRGSSRKCEALIFIIGVARHYLCHRPVIEMLHPVSMCPRELRVFFLVEIQQGPLPSLDAQLLAHHRAR